MENFNISKRTVVNITIFKKIFYEEGGLNKSEMKIFTDNIDKITLLFSFTEDNMNIKPYIDEDREYDEIAIIQVAINDKSKSGKIGEIIQRTIQYPIVILFTMGDEVQINVATKIINKSDESKNVVEKTIRTHWINKSNLTKIEKDFFKSLDMKELSFANFHRFYMDIFDRVFMLNTAAYTKDYNILLIKDIEKIKEIQNKINIIELTLDQLRKKIKKEDNFSRKVNLNIKIKTIEEEKNRLIGRLLV